MLKTTLAALTVVVALGVLPASAQQSQPQAPRPEAGVVGLPVYSSDGQMLGQVTGTSGPASKQLLADMGAFLGLGPSTILIDPDVFRKKPDRIELTMTAAEVKERVSKQGVRPSQ